MRHSKVGSVMTTDVVRAEYGTPFKEVVRLLSGHRIGGLPVVDEDERVVGVVSETDLVMRQALTRLPGEPKRRFRFLPLTAGARRRTAKAQARTAGQLMSRPPVTVHADDTVAQAARTMTERRVDRLPVLDEEDRLVGIVTRRDVLGVFLRADADIRAEVVGEVLQRSLWLIPTSVAVSVTEGVVTLDGEVDRRSEAEIAVALVRRIDGVVAVVDRLTHAFDDERLHAGDLTPHTMADGRPPRR
ncbi:CBS domain-containing protein [Streptomyces sp. KM77-8]|uniref:CBS domain-containing protein n=1 Tax=Streptomyces haneummycinicus TaxID=3074435 RepID=A0AAT9HKL2_9ACTN